MKLIKSIIILSTIIGSSIHAINTQLMNLFKESWQKNITLFNRDYYSYHNKQHRAELRDFVKSYEDLAHAVNFLEITTMPVTWQNLLVEAKKYLNVTAEYYLLVLHTLRDPGIIHSYKFQNPHNTISLCPCEYMQLSFVKAADFSHK